VLHAGGRRFTDESHGRKRSLIWTNRNEEKSQSKPQIVICSNILLGMARIADTHLESNTVYNVQLSLYLFCIRGNSQCACAHNFTKDAR
jgi:hypothetical protein